MLIKRHDVLEAAREIKIEKRVRGKSVDALGAFRKGETLAFSVRVPRRLGVSAVVMRIAPDGEEGYLYTAEQVYDMLLNNADKVKYDSWDNHDDWGKFDATTEVYEGWIKHFKDACASMEQRKKCGNVEIPLFAQRFLNELKSPQVDWRTVLNDFVQEDVNDYSFSPPDKRFSDSPFFLPDFNEKDDKVDDVLFMIDTSGSMSDKMISEAYFEIKGAIDQFGGKLCGWLGFFDAEVVPPVPFSSEEEFRVIRPKGGGGTDFNVIFEYVRDKMDTPPVSIVILTDGYAPYPKESAAMGVPVLWLINNKEVTPKWGRVARLI
jgi:predicted metal-dependent peptidase